MREIKFRGKQRSWIYGGISIFNGEATIFDENCVGVKPEYIVKVITCRQYAYVAHLRAKHCRQTNSANAGK